MSGEVIKSFLVELGFSIDDSSLSKFNKAISNATIKVAALYTGIQAAAAGIFYGISKMSASLEEVGYSLRIIAPAINKAILLRNAFLSAYRAAGVNITQAVLQSVKFNYSLAKTKFTLEAIYSSVGLKFLPLLTKQMDAFRGRILQNMPKIQAALGHFVEFIFKAFYATEILGERLWSILTRVYDFFAKLDQATGGWSTIILGVIAAWRLLNLEFLATPLGAIITGLVAILALFDDFKTFQEGGTSLFNWGPVIPIINAVTAAFWNLFGVVKDTVGMVTFLVQSLIRLGTLNFSGAFDSLKTAGSFGEDFIKNIVGAAKNGSAAVGAAFTAANGLVAPPALGVGQTSPLGVGGAQASLSQHVSQQTSIVVQGSADANATGKAVAGQQTRVNADLTRNLKVGAQ